MKHTGTVRIETENLILRRFRIDDAEAMFRNWAGDDEVTRYLTWPTHSDVEVSRSIIVMWEKEYDSLSSYQWCIESKETGQAVGSISVVNLREDIGMVEIGYCIGKEFWGKGITAEALKALIYFFFEEVQANRIEAKHDSRNIASGKVMEKCGMVREGEKKQGDRNNMGICDIVFHGLIRADWKKN